MKSYICDQRICLIMKKLIFAIGLIFVLSATSCIRWCSVRVKEDTYPLGPSACSHKISEITFLQRCAMKDPMQSGPGAFSKGVLWCLLLSLAVWTPGACGPNPSGEAPKARRQCEHRSHVTKARVSLACAARGRFHLHT